MTIPIVNKKTTHLIVEGDLDLRNFCKGSSISEFLFFYLSTTMTSRTSDYSPVVKSAYISPMNEHQFRQFIAERPALRLSILAEELGIDRVNLYKSSGVCVLYQKQNAVNFLSSLKNMGIRWNKQSDTTTNNKPPDHPQHAK